MFARFNALFPRAPEVARSQIIAGTARSYLRVAGNLQLANSAHLAMLPSGLRAPGIDLSDCRALSMLPVGLRCGELLMRRTNLRDLPADVQIERRLDAQDCPRLTMLPPLRLQDLNLHGCAALEILPDGLTARRLDLSGCLRLQCLPESATLAVEHLNVANCESLKSLPDNFERLQTLNVSGCAALTSLPMGFRIRSWIDVAGSGLRDLPWSLRSVRILWRGVPISDRVAFDPESITVREVLREENITFRRLLLDRMGVQKFFEQADPTVVDTDQDAGGRRRLLRISLPGEVIACIEVFCPSTGHRYFLRVPPTMQNCRQAVAWTAGFNDPAAYQPTQET